MLNDLSNQSPPRILIHDYVAKCDALPEDALQCQLWNAMRISKL